MKAEEFSLEAKKSSLKGLEKIQVSCLFTQQNCFVYKQTADDLGKRCGIPMFTTNHRAAQGGEAFWFGCLLLSKALFTVYRERIRLVNKLRKINKQRRLSLERGSRGREGNNRSR